MKTNRIIVFAGILAAICSCGKQQLPYDLEGTEHGVVVNIRKAAGSSTTLATDKSGDYKVVLSLIEQQGDASMLKEVQLMAIYTDGAKNKKSAKVVEGITSLPQTLTIDIADVCTKLGVETISIGDRIEFTPCVTLNSGTQIDGWTSYGGFNNTVFTSWQQADGPYAYRVAYTAFAPFIKSKYQGAAVPWTSDFGESGTVKVTQITDLPEAKWIPSGVADTDLVGLHIEGDMFWSKGVMGTSMGDEEIYLWINTQDFTVILPDQVMSAVFAYPGLGDAGKVGYLGEGEGEVDTLNHRISIYFVPTFGAGYWFGGGFEMYFDFA